MSVGGSLFSGVGGVLWGVVVGFDPVGEGVGYVCAYASEVDHAGGAVHGGDLGVEGGQQDVDGVECFGEVGGGCFRFV